MLRIRKITDTRTEADALAVAEVQAMIRDQFSGMPAADIDKLPDQLADPFRYGFVSNLYVSEGAEAHVRAFALVLYDPQLMFAYLELISTARGGSGSGLGAALYQRVRTEATAFGADGLYFECLPDDPALSPNAKLRRQNAARLRFYERYGARPILGTAYETPVTPGTTDSPYLVVDGLGGAGLPGAERLRAIVRAILERKYAAICPPGYIDGVVASIRDETLVLRPPRYSVPAPVPTPASSFPASAVPTAPPPWKIPLVVNQQHEIHHIRERGYVEAPVRIRSILRELEKSGLFEEIPPQAFDDRLIREVHDGALVDYIEQACAEAPIKKSIYPYVFPVRNPERKPLERSVLAGYWCIDTFTPLNRNAFPAARQAVNCALTAAERLLHGDRLAYALVRPPGHHAERRSFGGFCYFNNAAVAAQFLSHRGRVAVFDIDYHHGNGTQDIFYQRADVLTVSVHGDPSFAYPYFTGFADETGRGKGAGFNLNIALPETITVAEHAAAVQTGLDRIARHAPDFLVLSVGFDTAKGDPTGTWPNQAADFIALGRRIGETGYPILVVQEGGYRVRTLGVNARSFFTGLITGAARVQPRRRTGRKPASAPASAPRRPAPLGAAPVWRAVVTAADVEAIRSLVAATGLFSTGETAIAAELVTARVEQGPASGYAFVLAEVEDRLVGFACYGATPGTEGAYDLYWIVVAPTAQRGGIGRALLNRVEQAIAAAGGRFVYADTSSTAAYAPTRAFYRKLGFRKLAELPDFYRPGDGKVILRKELRHDDTADHPRGPAG